MFNSVDSGVKVYRSRKQLNYSHDTDVDFGYVYPMFYQFVLPGDVLKISARVFARYQPTLAPILNSAKIRYRFFFVNLRQIEKKTETVITGSNDGQKTSDVPVFKSFIDDVTDDSNYVVSKHKFWDYIGIACKNYKKLKGSKCIPANYWFKAYKKIEWDFYRDENIDTEYEDFESWFEGEFSDLGGQADLFSACLPKDYFTSGTPFELKGETPTFDVEVTTPFIERDSDGNDVMADVGFMEADSTPKRFGSNLRHKFAYKTTPQEYQQDPNTDGTYYINGSATPINLDGAAPTGSTDPFWAIGGISGKRLNEIWSGFSGSFNARDVRRMFSLTRIKERDMRCGSRYTEYLRANFKTAPADETLQRPVYLGGFRQPIVTNEVLQTGADGANPVGTMRGKGITDGGNTLRPYHAKEFGVILGLLDVIPDILYTQGVDRQLSYKSRYDFFNPSFQNLSEQEVRNGEIYIDEDDGKNDETFCFQGMYNELRSRRNIVTGDMRDSLKYWTQAIEFASRPNWNGNFIKASNYNTYFKRPFAVIGANPIILHVDNVVDSYRPMISEPVPGLIDHN